ncbi:PREDICTED: pancreatic triacylglycerol lipase-like [Nanorana parkeri]|uniref:pancreatic triacylglycerol lipase-like n=1 Tax=Nanorana parkeri TaxID=125878 RepID=UPI000853F821|nr:PREDICTED: pancreatic triacylglycerol lipase-like [Nanorana parkeri]
MLPAWIIGIFFLGAVKGADVCYDRLGCFTDAWPYSGSVQRPTAKLPWTPERINTRFFLYTRSNQNSYQVISAINPSTISSSNFRTSRKTRFVTHGFTSSGEASWLSQTCRAFFEVEDVNCIAVDWAGGSRTTYSQAANNIRVVGAEIAYFVNYLSTALGYSPSNVHVIGHSLGGHVAGEAGKRMRGIARITGLDPAEPYFQDTPAEVRLDLTDGVFVDVIHTDAGAVLPNLGLGMSQVIGHVDFFPNGGVQMPECQAYKTVDIYDEEILDPTFFSLLCNHDAAKVYYIHSITNPSAYVGYPCSSWNSYVAGSCRSCPSAGCPVMGHYADSYRGVTNSSQAFYLNTA